MSALLETDWFVWGIGLIIGFQVLVVILGELLYRADRRALPIAPILRALRNTVLPLLVIYIFVVKILQEPADTVAVRVVTTTLWISVIYAGMLILNLLVFEQAPEGSWRYRAPSLFQDLLRMLLVAVGAAIVLAVVWEQNLGGLIAALGVGSIVLGLALQETLGNLMSGIALLFEKPFTIGDWIAVGDDAGEVVEINWRSVQVRTRERNLLIFPNSVLGRETIVNYARPSSLQTLRLSFGFSLDDPPNKVKGMLVAVAEQMDSVLDDPPPRALLREVLQDRMRYEAFLFIDQPKLIPQIVDAFTSRVWYAARRAGLHLPLPAAEEYQIQTPDREPVEPPLDIVAELKRAQGFDVLDADTISKLAERARIYTFGDDEILIRAGEIAENVYVIVRGQIRLTLERDAETLAETFYERGEAIGIVSLTGRDASAVTCRAAGDATVLRFAIEDIATLVRSSPPLAHQFARILEIRREAAAQAFAIQTGGAPAEDQVLPVSFRRPQSEPDAEGDGES
jgi:small-conductance mechanosensitive channel/CRP-like cAMP-binding protein